MKKQPPDTWATGIFYRVDPELEAIGPRLNFIRRNELNDRRPNYTKQSLEQLAAGLSEFCRDRPTPPTISTPPTEAERFEMTLAMARLANSQAASALRELANNARALEALNHRQDTADGEFLGLNRAVHLHVLREIGGAQVKAMQIAVSVAWGSVKPAQVKDDYTKHGAAAAQLVESIVEEAMRHPAYETREAALDALAADMDDRAQRCAPKRRRIKKRNLSA